MAALFLSGRMLMRLLTFEQRAILFRGQMILLAEGVLCLGSWYVWASTRNLFNAALKRSRRRLVVYSSWFTKLIVAVVLFLAQLSFVIHYLVHGKDPPLVSLACFVCLGLYIQFILCYFCLNSVYRIIFWIKCRLSPRQDTRRSFTVQLINFVVAVLFSISMCAYGLHGGSREPVVKSVEIPIKGLPTSMDRMSMAVISDIHLGPTVGRTKLEVIVDIVNNLKPDIVALIGDLTDASVERNRDAAAALKRIRARVGKYFVTGNHEYYTADVVNWFKHLTDELGFTVLHNGHVNVTDGAGEHFCLAGCDDIAGSMMLDPDHGMDLDKAVGSCDQHRPIILLAHQPRAAKQALDSQYNIQLVLSGHTHGGQMFPMVIIAYLVNPFFSGLYQYEQGHVYVTQGTVYWGIPMRMFTEAEITRVFLISA